MARAWGEGLVRSFNVSLRHVTHWLWNLWSLFVHDDSATTIKLDVAFEFGRARPVDRVKVHTPIAVSLTQEKEEYRPIFVSGQLDLDAASDADVRLVLKSSKIGTAHSNEFSVTSTNEYVVIVASKSAAYSFDHEIPSAVTIQINPIKFVSVH